jgi:hypothetical protein
MPHKQIRFLCMAAAVTSALSISALYPSICLPNMPPIHKDGERGAGDRKRARERDAGEQNR